MYKIKEQVTETVLDFKQAVKNTERFVQAASLLVVSAYVIYSLKQLELHRYVELAVLVSAIVVGLRAAYEYFRFMADRNK